MMHPRQLNGRAQIVSPVEVEQRLRDGTEDARAAGATEGEPGGGLVRFRGRGEGGVVNDEGGGGRERALRGGGVVEGGSCGSGGRSVQESVDGRKGNGEEGRGEGKGDIRANPNALLIPGVAKSSISSFRIMPVSRSMTLEPKIRLTVVVSDTAPPHWSIVER